MTQNNDRMTHLLNNKSEESTELPRFSFYSPGNGQHSEG